MMLGFFGFIGLYVTFGLRVCYSYSFSFSVGRTWRTTRSVTPSQIMVGLKDPRMKRKSLIGYLFDRDTVFPHDKQAQDFAAFAKLCSEKPNLEEMIEVDLAVHSNMQSLLSTDSLTFMKFLTSNKIDISHTKSIDQENILVLVSLDDVSDNDKRQIWSSWFGVFRLPRRRYRTGATKLCYITIPYYYYLVHLQRPHIVKYYLA